MNFRTNYYTKLIVFLALLTFLYVHRYYEKKQGEFTLSCIGTMMNNDLKNGREISFKSIKNYPLENLKFENYDQIYAPLRKEYFLFFPVKVVSFTKKRLLCDNRFDNLNIQCAYNFKGFDFLNPIDPHENTIQLNINRESGHIILISSIQISNEKNEKIQKIQTFLGNCKIK